MAKLQPVDASKIAENNTRNEKISMSGAPPEKNQINGPNVLIKLSERLRINRPLVPLKIAVFCWFGAGAVVTPFLALYLKQAGLTLKTLSLIYMVLPAVQFLGPTISGAIADKIGRSKPVLQANLFLAIVSTTCLLFIPKLKYCNQELIQCHSRVIDDAVVVSYCDIQSNGSEYFNCSFQCQFDTTHQFKDRCFQDYISSCGILSQHGFINDSIWSQNNSDYQKYSECVKDLKPDKNTTNDLWCQHHIVKDCNSTCNQNVNSTEIAPCEDAGNEKQLIIYSFLLLAAFHTFYSNCYRIIDVTSMSMIKTYNSDFGRQRFWSILGILVFSPLAGYLITLVSPANGPPKYETVFYFFDAMALLTMAVVWKLDVKTDPPSKDLLKKILILLKNVDVMVFFTTVLVIGTSWGFTKMFSNWYLEDLNAPSSLIGLIPAVNSIIGLPFLLTSKFFVSKVGSSNLLILAFLGYAAWCIGYSFLQNPWWSLAYEVFGIVNYHLLWVTVVTRSHAVAPIGLAATAISIAGGIHFGIGKGTGSLIGGFIMSKYGGRLAYRVMASICVGSAVLYSLYLYIRRKSTTKEMDLRSETGNGTTDFEFDEKFTPIIF